MRKKGKTHIPRPLRLAGRFVRRAWQVLLVVSLLVGLGVAAYLNPGLVQSDVRLDEGTVYAGNRGLAMVGTVNAQIDLLSDGAAVGDTSFEILQHEDLVLVHSTESDRLARYTPGTNRFSLPTQLPANAKVQLVGPNLLVVNPVDGRAWAGSAEALLDYDFDKQQADLEIGEQGIATLTVSGEIIGLDPNRSVLVRSEEGSIETVELPFKTEPNSVEISAVGERALVLDRSAGRIWLEGMAKAFDVSGVGGAQLMAPAADALGGEDGARAIYATQAGLIALTNDGPRSLSGQMNAAAIAPIQVDKCVYGAFGDQAVQKCAGGEVQIQTIPEYPAGAELVFGVNRSVVTLNDLAGGNVWLVNEGMKLVNNWQDVTPRNEDPENPNPEVKPFVPPDRDEANQPPVAQDDELAARAGRSTVLPVLDNDTDPDGDVLTISAPAELDGARLSPVRNGAGLQISIDPEASGTLTFTYSVNDGREGGTDTAEVTLRILPTDQASENSLPHKFELAQDLTISQRQIFTKQVLLDWRDADGDSLMLKKAWLDEEAEDRVVFTSDGTLTFTDVGKTTGPKIVHVLVSDGFSEREGQFKVNVSPDAVAPIAYGDFATTTVGESVEVAPLANDIGYLLSLSEVTTDCERCTLAPNYAEGIFNFTAPQAGTYYLTYTARSAEPAVGIVRIDVRADGSGTPPVAALDVAMLPPGGSVAIDPLLNDTDADGDVLVIQTVSQPPGLSIVLQRRHLLTITANSHPSAPVTLEYRVSDGHHSVIGHIVVIPTETVGTVKPQPQDDSIAVRAGNTVAANLLANDESPIGLDLEVTRLVRNPLGDNAWVDGDQLRVRAPSGALATSTSIDYEVADTDGRTGVATVQVEISAEDSNTTAPQPRKIVDRVLAGTTTRIPIDLTGIDPSGNSVRLVGVGSGPTLGRVTEVGEKYLTYEAYAGSQGTDTFLYEVINRAGMRATGQLRIGVAPPGTQNTAPTGTTDRVVVKPGRHVQIAALGNDFDLDGDTLSYAATDPVAFQDENISASVVDNREIVLTAPQQPGTYAGSYSIVDGRGQQGEGSILITVDPNAELLSPVTRDDTVPIVTTLDQEWVEIDALANDYDPDGAHTALKIELPDFEGKADDTARITDDGRRMTVQVLNQMQQVRYRAVDADGNGTYGVVTVPGRDDSVPVLRDSNLELEAVAGQPLIFEIGTYVLGSANRAVRLTTVEHVSATQGSAVPDGPTSIRYEADALYEGPASVVFEVTDQVDEGDTTAKTAFVSMRINVKPAPDRSAEDARLANEPPRLVVENPTIQIAPGEGEERLDLVSLFRDPEGQDLFVASLDAQGGDDRVNWRLDGTTLVTSTAINTPATTTRTLSGSMQDASDGATPFSIQIIVTSSRQPLTETSDDHVPQAGAGIPVQIPVLDNDVSFLSDKSLTVVGAEVISGAASIEYNPRGVTVLPSSGTNGTIVARYTVQDATQDAARNVDGRITVDVQDRPARPLTPYPEGVGDGEVTVTYVSSGDGGRPVTRRIATATSPGEPSVVQDCPSERCTVTGLRNGLPWSVSIVEVNELGHSDPSPPSAPQVPDAKPLPPSQPKVDFGDHALTVSWTHDPQYSSSLGGSPIQAYRITLLNSSGHELGTQTVDGGQRSYTWTGLSNGTSYAFQVSAENDQRVSDPSAVSATEVPSGLPTGNQRLQVSVIEDEIGGGFRVSFDPSKVGANGDNVTGYTIMPVTASGEVPAHAQTVGNTVTSVNITGMGTTPTRFVLKATNRSGTAEVGSSDGYLIAYKLPQITRAVGTAGDTTVTVEVDVEADPGAPVVIKYNAGSGWYELPSDRTIRGLRNGEEYTVKLQAFVLNLASAEKSVGAFRPKGREPLALKPNEASMRLTSSLKVEIDVPEVNLVATGGWEPSGYNWCLGGSGCTPSKVSTLTLEPGATNIFYWQWGNNEYRGTSELKVNAVTTPQWNGRNLVFQFPYVSTGRCTVTSFANGYSAQTEVRLSNSVVRYDRPPPRVGSAAAQAVSVSCSLNGASFTFTPAMPE